MNHPVKNIGTVEIPPFGVLTAPTADTPSATNRQVEIHVRSLLDNNESGSGTFQSDLHYHNMLGVNGPGRITANNGRGHARFDLETPQVIATDSDDIATTDILIATSDAATLKKLDRGEPGTPGDYTNIFGMFRPLKRSSEKIWIVSRIQNPLFVCRAAEDASGAACVAEILQHGDEDAGTIDVPLDSPKYITCFVKESVSEGDSLVVALISGALIPLGSGAGGGGSGASNGACGPCGPNVEVGTTEVMGQRLATYEYWDDPFDDAAGHVGALDSEDMKWYAPDFELTCPPPPEPPPEA